MRLSLFFAVILLAFLSSCVPISKLVYLQNDDLKKRKEIPRDTVLRTHEMLINEYKIQPLDILSINFETLSEENNAFDFLQKLSPQSRNGGGNTNAMAMNGIFVSAEGDVEYAVLGKIHVAGLTIFQAEQAIRKVALQYVPDVVVRVRMLNFRFTVLGEVNRESVETSMNPRLTIMEAIGMSGGFGELADRSLVKVVRQNGSATEIYYVNLLEEDFIESPFYYVQQNDLIIVPPLKQRTYKRYFTSNLSYITSIISFGLLIFTLTQL